MYARVGLEGAKPELALDFYGYLLMCLADIQVFGCRSYCSPPATSQDVAVLAGDVWARHALPDPAQQSDVQA